MSENAALPLDQDVSRELPSQITIPPIKGEMVHLRPASVDDLPRMDELDAYYGASKITGKDAQAERAVVILREIFAARNDGLRNCFYGGEWNA